MRRLVSAVKLSAIRATALSACVVGILGATAVPATANWLFTPEWKVVRRTAAPAVAMAWAGTGDLWVAEKRANGKLLLEHLSGGRWTSTPLDVRVGSDLQLDAVGARDVWMVNGGRLWAYDAKGWRSVALPAARPGTSVRATTVKAVAGASTYVGLVGDGLRDGAGVYELRGGRWSSLGRPAAGGAHAWAPKRIATAGGNVYADFVRTTAGRAERDEVAFRYVNKAWVNLGVLADSTSKQTSTVAAWVFPAEEQFIALGTSKSGRASGTLCSEWYAGAKVTACETRWQVTAAEMWLGNNIAIGGYERTADGRTKAVFAYRHLWGDYSYVKGNPGDAVIAMRGVSSDDNPWAITRTGSATYLQRLAIEP